MNEHVAKPIDIARLQATLAHWLGAAPGTTAVPDQPATPARVDIDRPAALARLGQNEALYDRLGRRFRDAHAADGDRLRAAIGSGDQAGAILLAHTLRGLAGNLGGNRLAALAGELETALRQGPADPAELAGRLDGLADALAQLLSHLESCAAPPADSAAPAGTADPAALRAALSQLRQLLDNCDAEAVQAFDALAGSLRRVGAAPLVDQLARHIGHYEFQAAGATLGQIADPLNP
jgi:HPt (histidine-containing phosphotransfer) domain-containing protein